MCVGGWVGVDVMSVVVTEYEGTDMRVECDDGGVGMVTVQNV